MKLLRVVLPALVSAITLAGCNGGSAGSPGSSPFLGAPSNANLQANAADILKAVTNPLTDRIFVADFNGGGLGYINSYQESGKYVFQNGGGLDGPQNIVTDSSGDVFVANFGSNVITSFTKALKPYKPNVSLPSSPVGLALGPQGKLYATLYPSGTLVTYDANGQQIAPTITGPGNVTYVAVDAAGKIYITNSSANTLNTYKPDGTPTTPTITAGLNGPGPVVVDGAGKIYVGNSGSNSITTYKANGARTSPTISVNGPHGLAVAKDGNIYVTDSVDKIVKTFTATGAPAKPTITGFTSPTGIAVFDR